MKQRPIIWNLPFLLSLCAYLALICLAMAVQNWWPDKYPFILGDAGYRGTESLREWASLPLLFGTTALAGWFYAKQKPRREALVWIACWTFLLGMEECDWTQQIFGFPTPEFFVRLNAQRALNLHNMWFPFGTVIAVLFFLPVIVYVGLSFYRFMRSCDGVALNVLAWMCLCISTDLYLGEAYKGTLLQLSLYLFLLFHAWQLDRLGAGKIGMAKERNLFLYLLSREQREPAKR